jgi:hypothetical protein
VSVLQERANLLSREVVPVGVVALPVSFEEEVPGLRLEVGLKPVGEVLVVLREAE